MTVTPLDIYTTAREALAYTATLAVSDHRRRRTIVRVRNLLTMARDAVNPDYPTADDLRGIYNTMIACLRAGRHRDILDAITLLTRLEAVWRKAEEAATNG